MKPIGLEARKNPWGAWSVIRIRMLSDHKSNPTGHSVSKDVRVKVKSVGFSLCEALFRSVFSSFFHSQIAVALAGAAGATAAAGPSYGSNGQCLGQCHPWSMFCRFEYFPKLRSHTREWANLILCAQNIYIIYNYLYLRVIRVCIYIYIIYIHIYIYTYMYV